MAGLQLPEKPRHGTSAGSAVHTMCKASPPPSALRRASRQAPQALATAAPIVCWQTVGTNIPALPGASDRQGGARQGAARALPIVHHRPRHLRRVVSSLAEQPAHGRPATKPHPPPQPPLPPPPRAACRVAARSSARACGRATPTSRSCPATPAAASASRRDMRRIYAGKSVCRGNSCVPQYSKGPDM